MSEAASAEHLYYSPAAVGRFTRLERTLRRRQLENLRTIKLPGIESALDFISEHGQRVIDSPLFGAWLDRLIQTQDFPHDEASHAETLRRIFYIGNYAATVTLTSGQEKETSVLPHNGRVMIPELGRIVLEGLDDTFIRVAVNGGGITADTPSGSIHIARDSMAEATPNWEPLRYIGPPDFTVPLNDIDPNRDVFRYPAAGRLSEAEYTHWHTVFGQAWEFIQEHDPYAADIVRASLAAIVPAPAEPLTHGKSMAAGAAFGVIGINECRDPERLASHIAFGTRKHMAIALKGETGAMDFAEGDQFTTMPTYPPSREGHATIPHLLEDGFINIGLARYSANVASNVDAHLQTYAQLSFARWFVESQQNLEGLLASGYATESNAAVAAALQQELTALAEQYRQTPEPLKRAVATNVIDRYLSWRLHNSTPDAHAVQYLRDAWLRKAPAPSLTVPGALSESIEAYTHIGQRTRYVLLESQFKDPQHFAAIQQGKIDPQRFGNPTAGDIAFASGDIREARNYFRAVIQHTPHSKEAWAGFAITFEHDRSGACAALLQSPDLVAAVYAAIGDSNVLPESVAAWLPGCKVANGVQQL